MSTNLKRCVSLGPGWAYAPSLQTITGQGLGDDSGDAFVEWDNVTFLNDTKTPWVKLWASLSKLFPSAGAQPDPNVFGALDKQITLARQYGFGILLTIEHNMPEWLWSPQIVGQKRFDWAPSVAMGSPWATMVDFLIRRYSQYNPNRPDYDCWINVLEVLNEPNLYHHTTDENANRAADAMATAKRLLNAAGNPMVVGGPSTWDGGTEYNAFTDAVLAHLATNGFYSATANNSGVVWTQHNYYDALNQRASLASTDTVRKLNSIGWRGWPSGQPGTGALFLTEGLIDRGRLSSNQDTVQANLISNIASRLYSGSDAAQIELLTQYLFYSDSNFDSGLLDPFNASATPRYRPAYDKWKQAPSAGWPPAPPSWRPWISLGGATGSQAEALSFSSEHLDVYARGTDNALYHRWREDRDTWAPWTPLGSPIIGAPSAVSWNPSHVDVFARGGNWDLVHTTWNGNTWTGLQSLGGRLSADPFAVSWGSGHTDVYVCGDPGGLFHRWYVSGVWSSDWQPLGGNTVGKPCAISWYVGHVDVFTRWTDGRLFHIWYDGSSWQPWWDLGGELGSDPVALSWGSGHVDVYVRWTDGTYRHRWWDGSTWQPWWNLGGSFISKPTIASWRTGHVVVAGINTNGELLTRYFDNSQWSPDWYNHGHAPLTSDPRIKTVGASGLALLASGSSGEVFYRYFR